MRSEKKRSTFYQAGFYCKACDTTEIVYGKDAWLSKCYTCSGPMVAKWGKITTTVSTTSSFTPRDPSTVVATPFGDMLVVPGGKKT